MKRVQHPLVDAESALQVIAAAYRAASWNSAAVDQAIHTVESAGIAVASRILARPTRGCDLDPVDAVQEWLMKLVCGRGLEAYEPDEPLFPFAYIILINVCRDVLRRAAIRRSVAMPPDFPDDKTNPLKAAAQRETRGQVRAAVKSLSPILRAAVISHFWKSQPPDATRQSLQARVRTQRSRAYKKLRELLMDCHE